MEPFVEMSDDELTATFDTLQVQITALQAQQTAIDQERRRRYAESQQGELARLKAQVAAFEKSLEVPSATG